MKKIFKGKTILITGGTGYIGSHGVIAFEESGYKTIIVDDFSNSNKKQLDGIIKILGYSPKFYNIDLKNKKQLEKVFLKNHIDGVIHFAGWKSPFESQEKSIHYFQNNITGSINLFETMDKYNVKNIVFSSSANTYSIKNTPPIKESDSQDTTNPYGTSKLLIEKLLKDLANFNNFNVVCLRYFNPIGAHSSGYLGEESNGKPNNLFPFIFKVLTGKLDKLTIFGNDYKTLDGTGVRDYIDVVDLVKSHLLSYNYLEKNNYNGYFDVFNVGTGKGISVLQVIKFVENIFGKKIKYSIELRRKGDIPISYCDNTKIKNILGFSPKIDIKESIKNSWKFYNKK